MGKKKAAPTMKDVASEAGVALGTVSKVVNGIPVGKEYQKKVEEVIKKLGYHVNSYAQGMKANQTRTVAFLIPNTIDPFFGKLTYYVNRSLSKRGYRMLLCATDGNGDVEQGFIEMAQQNQVDAIIALTYNEILSLRGDTPLITIDRILEGVPCVSSDNYSGGQLAAKKLKELGCQSVAFLGIGSPLLNEVTKRGEGFQSACARLELSCTAINVYDGTPFTVFVDFLNEHPDLDGLFCVTDGLAEQIMEYLRAQGRRIPEDIQIIGFDGIQRFSTGKYLCSTIVQSAEKLAEMSVELALSQDWPKHSSLVCIPVYYANGGTTREPPVEQSAAQTETGTGQKPLR